jgi:hypothetical protein
LGGRLSIAALSVARAHAGLGDINLTDVPEDLGQAIERGGIEPCFWAISPETLAEELKVFNFSPSREAALHRLGKHAAQFALTYSRLGETHSYDDIAFRYCCACPVMGLNSIQTLRGLYDSDRAARAGLPQAGSQPLAADSDVPIQMISIGRRVTLSNLSDCREDFDISMFEGMASDDDANVLPEPRSEHPPQYVTLRSLLQAGCFPTFATAPRVGHEAGVEGVLRIFVSHRWLTPEHPDPARSHYELVMRKLVESCVVALAVAALRGLYSPRKSIPAMNGAHVGFSGDSLAEALIVNVVRLALVTADSETLLEEAKDASAHIRDAGGLEQMDSAALLDVCAGRTFLSTLIDRICVWYDYSCVPQDPRQELEAIERAAILLSLREYIDASYCLFVVDEPHDFFSRAWCAFESIAGRSRESSVIGSAVLGGPLAKRSEHYPGHLLQLIRRAIFDTELLGVQDAKVCMQRLGLRATVPADLDFIYERLREMVFDQLPFIFDDTEVVTGAFPIACESTGDGGVFPSHLWPAHVVLRGLEVGSLQFAGATLLRQIEEGSAATMPYKQYLNTSSHSTPACIVVIGGCEAEAILWSDTIDRAVPQLERRLRVQFVSRCWLATDIAPVGCMPCGILETHQMSAEVWLIVTSQARAERCPLVRTVLQGPALLGKQVLVIEIDHSRGNLLACTATLDSEAMQRFPPRRVERFRPSRIEGGLLRNELADFLE